MADTIRRPSVDVPNAWSTTVSSNIAGVDARLRESLERAAGIFARNHPGYRVEGFSGRKGRRSTVNHPRGLAVDVNIIDPNGKRLGNLRNAATFRNYEKLAQTWRGVLDREYPDLANRGRWGGYFKQGVAFDQMHFDLGPRNQTAYGNWDTGLNDAGRRLMPGAQSVGMLGMKPQTQMASLPSIGPTPFGRTQANPNILAASTEDPVEVAGLKSPLGIGNVPASQSLTITSYADVGFPGFDGVQRAPLGPISRPAPAMPPTEALNPVRPTQSLMPTPNSPLAMPSPDPARFAALPGPSSVSLPITPMGGFAIAEAPPMPAPNSPVAMPPQPQTSSIPAPAPTIPSAPAAPAPQMPRSIAPPERGLPTSLAPTAPRGDPFGSVASQDNFGNSLVTNQYGVTTATMPDGKQAAYSKGTAGPLGRTSLLGNVGMLKGAPGLVGGLLGAAIGSALLGPVGGVIGGFAGKSLIGGNLGRGGFPAAPGTFGESKGKALSKSERSDISPAADRSMSANRGRVSGLW